MGFRACGGWEGERGGEKEGGKGNMWKLEVMVMIMSRIWVVVDGRGGEGKGGGEGLEVIFFFQTC